MATSAESAARRPVPRVIRRLAKIALAVAAVALAREAAFRVQDRRLGPSVSGPATSHRAGSDDRVKP